MEQLPTLNAEITPPVRRLYPELRGFAIDTPALSWIYSKFSEAPRWYKARFCVGGLQVSTPHGALGDT